MRYGISSISRASSSAFMNCSGRNTLSCFTRPVTLALVIPFRCVYIYFFLGSMSFYTLVRPLISIRIWTLQVLISRKCASPLSNDLNQPVQIKTHYQSHVDPSLLSIFPSVLCPLSSTIAVAGSLHSIVRHEKLCISIANFSLSFFVQIVSRLLLC